MPHLTQVGPLSSTLLFHVLTHRGLGWTELPPGLTLREFCVSFMYDGSSLLKNVSRLP